MAGIEKRVINQEKYDKMANDHLLYLRGDEDKRADFSNCILNGIDMSEDDLSRALFVNSELNTWSEEYHSEEWYLHESNQTEYLEGTNFEGADFSNSDVSKADFSHALSLEGAIFIGSKFNRSSFTSEQKEQAIFTQKDLVARLSSAADEIKVAEKRVEEQGAILDSTSKEAVDKLETIFESTLKRFAREERIWILFVGMTFFGITWLGVLPIFISLWLKGSQYAFAFYAIFLFTIFASMAVWLLDAFTSDKLDNGQEGYVFFDNHPCLLKIFNFIKGALLFLQKPVILIITATVLLYVFNSENYEPPSISLEKLLTFIPLEITLLVFLYFSVVQYARAKKLRIEQQNKLAMIQFYVAHEAKGNKEHMSILLPKFADVLIREAMPDKNSSDKNLPIDEMIKIAELAVKNK